MLDEIVGSGLEPGERLDDRQSDSFQSPRYLTQVRRSAHLALVLMQRQEQIDGVCADQRRSARRRLAAETVAAQAVGFGHPRSGAIVPAVHTATTHVRDALDRSSGRYRYGRSDNATVHHLEDVLARLERAERALVFASGTAAAALLVLSLERPAHIVAPECMYSGFRHWFGHDAVTAGVEVTFVDMTEPSRVAAAVRPGRTRLVWVETPSNPFGTITDISRVAQVAHTAGALLVVDSTVSTPVLTAPIALGADIVLHSATKYLNGHSDVVAGALCFGPGGVARVAAVERMRCSMSSIIGGHEAALLLRGLRTLHLRVRHQSAAALIIAGRLERHPGVARILYPGLPGHPGHDIAKRQMLGGFGGMLSVRLRGGPPAAIEALPRFQVWLRATSLGGVESLVEHRASMEGMAGPSTSDMLRLSVGIECIDDLWADLEYALDEGGHS